MMELTQAYDEIETREEIGTRTDPAPRRQEQHKSEGRNVGSLEQWASLAGGAALAVAGLKRGGASGIATALLGGALVQRGATGHCPVYQSLGVNTADGGAALGREGKSHGLFGTGHDLHVERVVTVQRPTDEAFRFWRDFRNLPRFMNRLDGIAVESDTRSRWTVKTPVGTSLEWDVEITEERPNERIAWRSVEGAPVEHEAAVEFRPATGGRGTEVRMTIDFEPPAGAIGSAVAHAFSAVPKQQLHEDLRHFKQLIETGEIPTTDGQPSGRGRDRKSTPDRRA